MENANVSPPPPPEITRPEGLTDKNFPARNYDIQLPAPPRHLESMSVKPADLPEPGDEIHLLNRLTFGIAPGDLEYLRDIGIENWLDEQLDPGSIDDDKTENYIRKNYKTLTREVSDLVRNERYLAYRELKYATNYRALFSKRQLYEVMVEFWSNHFSIHHSQGWEPWLKTADDRDVIRPHALGNFRDLLYASAHSPAMLTYLDNHTNTKWGPNENYARELLELHTMGADNGYTQKDVEEVARCFTGLSIDYRRTNLGEFNFEDYNHDNKKKRVLGVKIPRGLGVEDAERVVDILAGHKSTAWYIAYKLCRRFISDDPPNRAVNKVKRAFINSDGDIKTTLRALFGHKDFWNSKDAKFRRPYEWLMAMMRASRPNFDVNRDEALTWYSYWMGQAPFEWAPPDGYPDEATAWANTNGLLNRWNLGIYHGHGWLWGTRDFYDDLVDANPGLSPAEWVDYFEENLLFRPMNQKHKEIMIEYASRGRKPNKPRSGWAEESMIRRLRAMMFNSPYFQFR